MIFKQQRRVTFTVVSNEALRDTRLSFKATGLLAYLLSLPDEWEPNGKQLASVKRDGRDAIHAAMSELEECGYLVRRRRQLENGTFDWEIDVHEQPVREIRTPSPAFPSTGEPSTEKPDSKEALRLLTDEPLSSDGDVERFSVSAPIGHIRKQTGLNRRKKPA